MDLGDSTDAKTLRRPIGARGVCFLPSVFETLLPAFLSFPRSLGLNSAHWSFLSSLHRHQSAPSSRLLFPLSFRRFIPFPASPIRSICRARGRNWRLAGATCAAAPRLALSGSISICPDFGRTAGCKEFFRRPRPSREYHGPASFLRSEIPTAEPPVPGLSIDSNIAARNRRRRKITAANSRN